jgi:hypothetical protein
MFTCLAPLNKVDKKHVTKHIGKHETQGLHVRYELTSKCDIKLFKAAVLLY